jgi:hypothetical protein
MWRIPAIGPRLAAGRPDHDGCADVGTRRVRRVIGSCRRCSGRGKATGEGKENALSCRAQGVVLCISAERRAATWRSVGGAFSSCGTSSSCARTACTRSTGWREWFCAHSRGAHPGLALAYMCSSSARPFRSRFERTAGHRWRRSPGANPRGRGRLAFDVIN